MINKANIKKAQQQWIELKDDDSKRHLKFLMMGGNSSSVLTFFSNSIPKKLLFFFLRILYTVLLYPGWVLWPLSMFCHSRCSKDDYLDFLLVIFVGEKLYKNLQRLDRWVKTTTDRLLWELGAKALCFSKQIHIFLKKYNSSLTLYFYTLILP